MHENYETLTTVKSKLAKSLLKTSLNYFLLTLDKRYFKETSYSLDLASYFCFTLFLDNNYSTSKKKRKL